MRILLITVLFIACGSVKGQISMSTYYSFRSDLAISIHNSSITFKPNGTYVYRWDTKPQSCWVNRELKGKWITHFDTLILIDSVQSRTSHIEAAFRTFKTTAIKTYYKIDLFKKSLIFIKRVNEFDNTTSDFNLWGDFKMQ